MSFEEDERNRRQLREIEDLRQAMRTRYVPVTWIDTYCTDCSIGLRDNDSKAIKKLLEDWRKENEGNDL